MRLRPALGGRWWSGCAAAGMSFLGASGGRGALKELQPGGTALWQRVNHRGEAISLLAGPALTLGLLSGTLITGGTGQVSAVRQRLGHSVAIGGAGAFGLIDDLAEGQENRAKGLKGHLGELRRGRLTTGALKVLGIGATAGAAALLLTRSDGSRIGYFADAALNTALIAGSANLMNLLDLRPGRAMKAGILAVAFGAAASAPQTVGSVAGACAALISADLAEEDMLGDCGANAMGASIGCGLADADRMSRIMATTVIIGLTFASERVSFSRVIDGNRTLQAFDALGRRP